MDTIITIGLAYVLVYIIVILHELSHVLLIILNKLNIKEINIGANLFKITIGKLKISPLIGTSYIGLDEEELKNINTLNFILIYISGILFNFIVIILLVPFMTYKFVQITFIVNILIIISNSIPIYGSDMANIYKKIRKNGSFKK